MSFPSPVGGTPYPEDFAPCVIFAILYGLLVPLLVFRCCDARSRTTLLIGTACYIIERVILFSFRAHQASHDSWRFSTGIMTWMQVDFGLGFIGIANDLVNISRCLLINPTYGSDTYAQSPSAESNPPAYMPQRRPLLGSGYFAGEPLPGTPDHPRQRFWSRRFSDFTNLAFLAAIVPGILSSSRYGSAVNGLTKSSFVMSLRYVSAGIGLFLALLLVSSAVWARLNMPRVSKRGADIIIGVSTLMCVIAIYRMGVMFNTTTSLDSRAPGALNSPGSKALFYIFHILPEWMAALILFGFNIRQMLGTGKWGDWRWKDETAKEKTKREAKEAKREAKWRQKPANSDKVATESINA
ncbi:hypothetical protein BD779DRAFT_913468 [Infundibulicybe gibba]|nr:hypothetical protein BD779DRAFT_913468 [Infundibulicybe gibba]